MRQAIEEENTTVWSSGREELTAEIEKTLNLGQEKRKKEGIIEPEISYSDSILGEEEYEEDEEQ